ncbi:MAG: Tetratricopeptide repeat protein [Verrucomicrobia bacterium ADurb.Bin345]|nr:MAG: Tetratricopeptide repeat protein [Verrucomicrobia bacterium ADurb.Bin345]
MTKQRSGIAEGTARLRAIASASMLCLAVVCAVTEVRAQSSETISAREPSDAYLALVRGDEARDGRDWQGAAAAYEEALTRYRRIAEAHPDWESDIVQYRILYCETQLDAIRGQLKLPTKGGDRGAVGDEDAAVDGGATAADAAQVGALEEDDEITQNRYLAVLQENEYLRRRMAELMDESEQEVGTAEESEDSFRAELATAQARILELQAQVAAQSKTPAHRAEKRYVDWMQDALARENAKDVKGAQKVYEKVLDRYPDDLPAFKGQARCLLTAGEIGKAAELVAGRADLKDPELPVLLAAAYGAMGKYRESADSVEALVREDPWNARARAALGAALLGLGEKESARKELEKALVLDRQLVDACYNLAWILSEATPADREKGREFYRRSVELGGAQDAALERRLAEP